MLERTAILIVNWNLRDDTLACLASLAAAGVVHKQIFVIDNGSTDGSVAAIRAAYPAVRQIESGENLGLSGGINLGLEAILAEDWDWVLLLNNDTVVEPEMFEHVAKAADARPEYALLGPRIVYFDDPERPWFLGERRVGGTLLGKPAQGSDGAVLPVDYLSGCAMWVRREVFEQVGGFDASLFLFAEEVDFCLRAARAGFRAAAVPGARLQHKVSLSTGRDKPGARYLRVRNQVRVYRRYAGWGQRVFLFGFTFLRVLVLGLGDMLRGAFDLAWQGLRGWAAGWYKPGV